jgi:hypothetical protein
MQDLPLGPLLFLIAFILLPFINWLLRRMGRRFERELPQEPLRQPAPRTFAKLPSFDPADSAAEEVPLVAAAESSPRPRRQRRNKIFTGRRDLRRAILLMTVLGPCRASNSADAEGRQLPR